MNYNFSSISEMSNFTKRLKTISSSISKDFDRVIKIDDPESVITSCYLLLDKCYMGLQEINLLKVFSKSDSSISQNVPNLIRENREVMSKILGKLESIAEEVKPKSYSDDISYISEYIKKAPLKTSIFPKEDSIIIYSVFPYLDKFLVFSTLYTQDNSKKYISISDISNILPGKYSLGREVDTLDNYFVTCKEDITNILKGVDVLPKNRIRAKVKEGINVDRAKELLCSFLKDYVKESVVLNDNIIISFNKLRDVDIRNLSSVLKLNCNDRYLMISMQGE